MIPPLPNDGAKDKGVDATNRDYIAYDQVHKEQSYRFAEAEGEEGFDDDYEIVTCDLGRFLHGDVGDRRRFAAELGTALEGIGFAILDGTGVDPAVYARAETEVTRLFTQYSIAEKMRFRARRHGSVNQGYFPIKETSDIHPDLVEGWVFCRRAFDLDDDPAQPTRVEDFWPDAEGERAFRALCRAQEPLILPIMQAVLTHLGCDPQLFDARLTDPSFALRLNYYPPLSKGDESSGAARLLGHEDVDLFTLLPSPASEGLQVLNRSTFKWVRLHAPPGTIVLNTGDYMQRISNDRLPSTTHRVSLPRHPALRGRARVSLPMNVYLWEDELLEVLPGLPNPRYEPVRALEFHTKTTAKYYGDDYSVS